MHRYRIEWVALNGTTDQVRFAIDGVQVAQFDVVSAGLSNLYLYFSNNGTTALSIDSAQVSPPYQGSGRYAGCDLDAGPGIVWNSLSWVADVPTLTGLSAEIRISADGLVWGDWLVMSNSSGTVINAAARDVEYRFNFTGDGQNTPVLLIGQQQGLEFGRAEIETEEHGRGV